MKRFASLIILVITLSAAVFAADGGTGKIHLDSVVKVGSTELPAGDYKVTWNGSGEQTQVTLTQGQTRVTAAAKVVEVRRKSDAISTKSENGARILTEIQFRNQTLMLQDASGPIAGQ
jgi:hypothetical protein